MWTATKGRTSSSPPIITDVTIYRLPEVEININLDLLPSKKASGPYSSSPAGKAPGSDASPVSADQPGTLGGSSAEPSNLEEDSEHRDSNLRRQPDCRRQGQKGGTKVTGDPDQRHPGPSPPNMLALSTHLPRANRPGRTPSGAMRQQSENSNFCKPSFGPHHHHHHHRQWGLDPKLSLLRPHIHLTHRPGRSLANPSHRLLNQCQVHQPTADITAFTHHMNLFSHVRIHDSGIHGNVDSTDTSSTTSAPPILTAIATPTTTNDKPPAPPDFSCPQHDDLRQRIYTARVILFASDGNRMLKVQAPLPCLDEQCRARFGADLLFQYSEWVTA
ncbi:unnamed protein product [Schistocephalus solidus]|uniref:Velvet domain-containing protein n=1 Tax=Schistocephalus solidus TaxID=70667 RepID=A0A183TC58_SCHSO|nr:unnamed protein product [Schistocephalus solidus]